MWQRSNGSCKHRREICGVFLPDIGCPVEKQAVSHIVSCTFVRKPICCRRKEEELRKERGLTQEQLAETLNVSGRTVSRWETGSNIPDLDTLIELADFYSVDIRELIDGERKCEEMNQQEKETLKKVADYAEEEKKMLAKRMMDMTGGAAILFAAFLALRLAGLDAVSPYENLSDFALGLTGAALLLNILYCAGILDKIRAAKLAFFEKRKANK